MGETVTATPKTYEGFTFDNTVEGTKESGEITEDGELELVLYYTRDKYAVTYAYTGTVPSGADPAPASAEYYHGAEVNVESLPQSVEVDGDTYAVSAWATTDVQVEEGKFIMPMSAVAFTGEFVTQK